MTIECDVLVVGGGPAGSSAARAAAKKGLNVYLIEKKNKPGKIACGEAIGAYLIPYLPFNLPTNQFTWQTKGMSFDIKDLHIERHGKLWQAYSVDRKKFDNLLFNYAKLQGAKAIINAEVKDLIIDTESESVRKVIVEKEKKKLEFKPKILIAADGAESSVLHLLGLYNPKKDDIAEIYSYEYKNVNIKHPQLEQIYLGEYINGGYGYVFPKSKKRVNIGVGSVFNQNLEKSFQEFIELPKIKKQIKNSTVVKEKIGLAPVSTFLEKNFHKNVLFTGDAAFQNFKPYAEGILPGIICGNLCGKSAYQILRKNADFKIYEKNINKKIGTLFKESDRITETIYDLFLMKEEKKFLLLAGFASNYFSFKEIEKYKKYDNSEIRKIINKKNSKEIVKKKIENIQLYLLNLKRLLN